MTKVTGQDEDTYTNVVIYVENGSWTKVKKISCDIKATFKALPNHDEKSEMPPWSLEDLPKKVILEIFSYEHERTWPLQKDPKDSGTYISNTL